MTTNRTEKWQGCSLKSSMTWCVGVRALPPTFPHPENKQLPHVLGRPWVTTLGRCSMTACPRRSTEAEIGPTPGHHGSTGAVSAPITCENPCMLSLSPRPASILLTLASFKPSLALSQKCSLLLTAAWWGPTLSYLC